MKFCRHLTVCKQLTILGYPGYPRYFSSSSSGSSSSKSFNYYDVLGIKKDCSRKEIRQAFLDKSKEYHPDSVSRSDLSAEQLKSKFQEINEAYQTLNDPSERRIYDETIRIPRRGYSNAGTWRTSSYSNFSDYQQYRAHQEFMRQQGHYWANYDRQSRQQFNQDFSWRSFYSWKMGQPMTIANFLLCIFIFGLTVEIFHTVYIVKYLSQAKRERALFGPDWFDNAKWTEESDDEILNRLVFMSNEKRAKSETKE